MSIGIPDYRLPREELNRDIDSMRELGVEIRLNTAIGRDVEFEELEREYDAVLLAVGAQRSQRLGVLAKIRMESFQQPISSRTSISILKPNLKAMLLL